MNKEETTLVRLAGFVESTSAHKKPLVFGKHPTRVELRKFPRLGREETLNSVHEFGIRRQSTRPGYPANIEVVVADSVRLVCPTVSVG